MRHIFILSYEYTMFNIKLIPLFITSARGARASTAPRPTSPLHSYVQYHAPHIWNLENMEWKGHRVSTSVPFISYFLTYGTIRVYHYWGTPLCTTIVYHHKVPPYHNRAIIVTRDFHNYGRSLSTYNSTITLYSILIHTICWENKFYYIILT